MSITGINHLTWAVRDVERSLAFYVGVLGLTRRARFEGGAYLTAGDTWVTLLEDGHTYLEGLGFVGYRSAAIRCRAPNRLRHRIA